MFHSVIDLKGCRNSHYHILISQCHTLKHFRIQHLDIDRDIELSGTETCVHAGGIRLRHIDPAFRIEPVVATDDIREKIGAEISGSSNIDDSRPDSGKIRKVMFDFIPQLINLSRLLKVILPCRCQCHRRDGTVKKRDPVKVLFQLFDRAAECWLGHIKLLGCLRKAALFGDLHHIFIFAPAEHAAFTPCFYLVFSCICQCHCQCVQRFP